MTFKTRKIRVFFFFFLPLLFPLHFLLSAERIQPFALHFTKLFVYYYSTYTRREVQIESKYDA